MNKETSLRLRKYRESLKQSQEQMAIFLGIERGSYTQIENGTNGIKDTHLFRLIEKGLNLNWLFTGKGEMLLSENELQEPLIYFGNVNHGIAGQMNNTYHTIGDCEKEVAFLKTENALLKQSVKDKELIISLLKNK